MQELEEIKLKGFSGDDEKEKKEANIEEIQKEVDRIYKTQAFLNQRVGDTGTTLYKLIEMEKLVDFQLNDKIKKMYDKATNSAKFSVSVVDAEKKIRGERKKKQKEEAIALGPNQTKMKSDEVQKIWTEKSTKATEMKKLTRPVIKRSSKPEIEEKKDDKPTKSQEDLDRERYLKF